LKSARSILSLALAVLLLTGFATTAFANDIAISESGGALPQAFAPAPGEDVTKYPTVYGAGAWHPLYENEEPVLPKTLVPGSPMETVFSPESTLGADAASRNAILDSILKLNMNGFADGLIQMWENSYGAVAMNKNGESINPDITCVIPYLRWLGKIYDADLAVPPGSLYTKEQLLAIIYKVKEDGLLGENKAFWTFDWRLDPYDNAVLLHEYIEWLIETYGKGNQNDDGSGHHNGYYGEPFDKVNFNAISGSGPIALAYLYLYGDSPDKHHLASLVFNISMHNGSSLFGGIATKNFGFDAASLAFGGMSMFGLQDSKTEGNMLSNMGPLLKGLYQVGLLDVLLKVFNFASSKAYNRFYEEAVIPLWFHMPTYWCMIPHNQYEKAKDLLLGSKKSEYSALLAKTDRYQNEIVVKQDELILRAASEFKVAVRAGYGSPMSPYAIGTNLQSDKLVDTVYASLGATCAAPGIPFSRLYKQAKLRGKDYMSPDRYVDASTCLLPDTTWFAKDLPHTAQWDYSGWYRWWLAAEDYTIWDDDRFPQYSQWAPKGEGESFDKFTPLTASESSWIDSLLALLKDAGIWLLKAWRWFILLPLFWMNCV